MKQTFFTRFKNGLNIGAASFAMLWQHPTLILYYFGLIAMYVLIYVVSYNVIGYLIPEAGSQFALNLLEDGFLTPNENLLSEVITSKGGLIYIGYIASIFLNIFLRTFVSFALILHTHAFLTQKDDTIGNVIKTTSTHWQTLLKWSGIVAFVTFGTMLLAHLPFSAHLISAIASSASIIWSIMTFFVLPILALTSRSISNSIYRSTQYFLAHVPEILGAMLWIVIVALILVISAMLFGTFLGSILQNQFIAIILPIVLGFALNPLFSTVLTIAKTKLYGAIKHQELMDHDQQQPDFSQF